VGEFCRFDLGTNARNVVFRSQLDDLLHLAGNGYLHKIGVCEKVRPQTP
jgi:hypothetical protein